MDVTLVTGGRTLKEATVEGGTKGEMGRGFGRNVVVEDMTDKEFG